MKNNTSNNQQNAETKAGLKKNLNTNYAFARKVVDPEVIDRIFNLE